MRTAVAIATGCAMGCLALPCTGQNTVIASSQGNGRIAWTNMPDSNAVYRVEWAARPGGPWQRSLQRIGLRDGLEATAFAAAVPRFFRVVVDTNEAPRGMVWIDGGDVELGQAGIEEPVHTNFISGFWMDDTEVTKKKWDEVYAWATTHGYMFDSPADGKSNYHPVCDMSWYDAVKWCNARSEMEELTPLYYETAFLSTVYRAGHVDVINTAVAWNGNGYRLPTEAEWEKAARGGRQRRFFPWGGDTIQHAQANYLSDPNAYPYDISPTLGLHPDYSIDPGPFTSPVRSFAANGFGLHDMAGNVYEWCWDWSDLYSDAYQTDPRGPTSGTNRVMRGGCYNSQAHSQRCAQRGTCRPGQHGSHIGFRCVRGP